MSAIESGALVEHTDKTRKKSAEIPEDLAENADVDQFFERLNSNVRRPKPGDEAVAAVVEALQRLTVFRRAAAPPHASGKGSLP